MVIVGLIALAVILWFINSYAKADIKALMKGGRTAGGVAAIGFAVFLGARGELAVAIPVALMGFGLMGWQPAWLPWTVPGFGSRTQRSPGRTSQVRAAFVEMELDHDTGTMRGRVTKGSRAGTSLDSLDVASAASLLGEFDDESGSLLAAYLDRRDPAWREHTQYRAAAGQFRAPDAGKMTEQEAYQILGLQPGASGEDIGRAHRSLMKKLHPDQGGSTYLAARVNEAKEILLRRHR